MATSAQQLLNGVADAAVGRIEPDSVSAEGAVLALGHLGRALEGLARVPIGVEGARLARRRLVVHELAVAAGRAAAQWPPGGDRLSDLAGAAADLISTSTIRPDADERWAAAIEVGQATRQCAGVAIRFTPYAQIPALTQVLRLSIVLHQLARLDPPGAAAGGWLDRAVPMTDLTLIATPAAGVRESVAGLVDSLERELRDGTLHIYAVLAAGAAAESCAQHIETLAASAPIESQPRPSVADGWRVLQSALLRFDDGSRYENSSSQVIEHALTLQRRVDDLAASRQEPRLRVESLTATRYVANQLPVVAALVTDAVQHWADSGRLFALARSLARSEERVPDVLRDDVVIVRPRDVGPVLMAARATARLSSALAVQLDRSTTLEGHQPQPRLAAALRSQLRPELGSRDARWATDLAARVDLTRAAAPAR